MRAFAVRVVSNSYEAVVGAPSALCGQRPTDYLSNDRWLDSALWLNIPCDKQRGVTVSNDSRALETIAFFTHEGALSVIVGESDVRCGFKIPYKDFTYC